MDTPHVVERIVKHRKTVQGFEFFIKWDGHDASKNSWEKEERIKRIAERSVFKYWEKYSKKCTKLTKTTSTERRTNDRRSRITATMRSEAPEPIRPEEPEPVRPEEPELASREVVTSPPRHTTVSQNLDGTARALEARLYDNSAVSREEGIPSVETSTYTFTRTPESSSADIHLRIQHSAIVVVDVNIPNNQY